MSDANEQAVRRLETTIDSIGEAVISTDRDGRIERLNPIAAALTGWNLGRARPRTGGPRELRDADPARWRRDPDRGHGLGDQLRLFVDFQQIESGASKSYGGTGLGLALTKRLVDARAVTSA